MSEFKANTSGIRGIANKYKRSIKSLNQAEEEIAQVQHNLSFEVAQKQQIQRRLSIAKNKISSHAKRMSDLRDALYQVADIYDATETELSGRVVPGAIVEPVTDASEVQDLISQTWADISTGIIPTLIKPGLLILSNIRDTIIQEIRNKELKDSYTVDQFDRQGEKTLYSKDKEQLKDSKIDPFKIFSEKWGGTISLWSSDGLFGDPDGTNASYSTDFLKAGANAELYGGLYYIDPDSGEKKLRMAAGVNLGCSLSALTMAQSARLGDENLGIYVKAEETFGKIGAGLSGVIGLHDAEGNFNPTAHVNMSLEAIAAEASVKGGVNVFGADLGVKASVNVGIGGHAEFGYKDGKFSADIGATFGIGGSVKLEIDIGGMVDTIADNAQAVWTGFMDLFK